MSKLAPVVQWNVSLRYCADPLRLLPLCRLCLITAPNKTGCVEASSGAQPLRQYYQQRTEKEQGRDSPQFHLYPYLLTPQFTSRHAFIAHWLAHQQPKALLEFGGHFQHIGKFLHGWCPQIVVMVDPVLSTASYLAPCGTSHVHMVIVAMTTNEFLLSPLYQTLSARQAFAAVICIGCDGASRYQMSQEQLLSLPRPYRLYLEYPVDYEGGKKFEDLQHELGVVPLASSSMTFHRYDAPHTKFNTRQIEVFDILPRSGPLFVSQGKGTSCRGKDNSNREGVDWVEQEVRSAAACFEACVSAVWGCFAVRWAPLRRDTDSCKLWKNPVSGVLKVDHKQSVCYVLAKNDTDATATATAQSQQQQQSQQPQQQPAQSAQQSEQQPQQQPRTEPQTAPAA
eukprot:g28944.t1